MDFMADLRDEILNKIPIQNDNARESLSALTLPSLLIRYLTWRERIVHAHPRRVHKSSELSSNQAYSTRRNEIHRIFAKIAIGQDISPHLSRNVRYGYETPKQGRKGGRDIDGFLNDWGIHHLHISAKIDTDGFSERGEHVLAVIFRQYDAYIIDVIGHNDWTEDDIVKTVITNWRKENLFIALSGTASETNISKDDRKQLRDAGVSSFSNSKSPRVAF